MISNVGPHFINCIVDPQNYGPNWSLCRDIKRSVAIKLLVFVVVSVVASCFLSRLVLWACSWIVLRHTLIMSRHKFYSAVLFLSDKNALCCDTKPVCNQLLMFLSFWSLSRHNFPCRNKHLIFILSTLSRQSFLCRDRISLSP